MFLVALSPSALKNRINPYEDGLLKKVTSRSTIRFHLQRGKGLRAEQDM